MLAWDVDEVSLCRISHELILGMVMSIWDFVIKFCLLLWICKPLLNKELGKKNKADVFSKVNDFNKLFCNICGSVKPLSTKFICKCIFLPKLNGLLLLKWKASMFVLDREVQKCILHFISRQENNDI